MMDAWAISALGELAEINYGFTAKASFEINGPKFLRITDIQGGAVNWNEVPSCKIDEADYLKYKLKVDDIVFVRTGATTGKSFLITKCENSVAASYLIRVRPMDDRILPDFLYLFFQSAAYWDTVNAGISGSAQGGFNASKLAGLVIPLPPIPEQKRIVVILDQAFADIEQARAKTEQNLKNASELFESYLQQVFSQRGEGWVESKLEDVTSSDCSLSYGIVQPGNNFDSGLPVVRPTDLTSETIKLRGLKLIDPLLADSYQRTTLQGGELLLCVRGSTGVISIADEELAGANVTRGIVPIRFDQEKIIQKFGYYQFISKKIQHQIKAGTYGAALMQINIRDLRRLNFLTPPKDFQVEVISKLDEITDLIKRLETIYRSKSLDLDELKKSILQKAFTGELTHIERKGVAA